MSEAPLQHLLVINDNKDNLTLLNTLLKTFGYKVTSADSGDKGITLARSEMPDLILLDIMMPNIDGFQVCCTLKEDDAITKDIPIIFLTAKTDIEDLNAGFMAGAVDFIHKPFNPAELTLRVQSQLKIAADRKRLAELEEENQRLRDQLRNN